jgi:hypothetical protein
MTATSRAPRWKNHARCPSAETVRERLEALVCRGDAVRWARSSTWNCPPWEPKELGTRIFNDWLGAGTLTTSPTEAATSGKTSMLRYAWPTDFPRDQNATPAADDAPPHSIATSLPLAGASATSWVTREMRP